MGTVLGVNDLVESNEKDISGYMIPVTLHSQDNEATTQKNNTTVLGLKSIEAAQNKELMEILGLINNANTQMEKVSDIQKRLTNVVKNLGKAAKAIQDLEINYRIVKNQYNDAKTVMNNASQKWYIWRMNNNNVKDE